MSKNDELDELYGSNVDIDIYLSYSRVADFSKNGPKALIIRQKLEGDGVKIGSLTDDWLFNQEKFEKIYFVFNGEKPTATLGKLVNIILTNYTEVPKLEEVLKIIERNHFWKRSKPDTVLAAFDIPEFWGYLKAQFMTNKVLVTTSQLELGQKLADTVRTHEHSAYIFDSYYDRHNQVKFELTYKNIKFRGIIDMVLIDHEYKTVRMIDLKTGERQSGEFISSLLRFRYYFQEAIYMKAFKKICETYKLKGYSLLPFQFLYIGRKEQVPIVFEISQKWHDAAIEGFTTNGGYHYKGLDETLEEIVWHWKNKQFSLPRNICENKGRINLNDEFFDIK